MLLKIARFGIPQSVIAGDKGEDNQNDTQCRLAALHILSACCSSTDTFTLQYANRNILSPNLLAQIVEEEASSSLYSSARSKEGAADITVAK